METFANTHIKNLTQFQPCPIPFHPRADIPAAAPAAFCQALVSELKEELMRLVGSTKKTQKIDNAPGMEVGGNAAGLCPTVRESRANL